MPGRAPDGAANFSAPDVHTAVCVLQGTLGYPPPGRFEGQKDIDGDDKANIVWIQDYVTQVGVSRAAGRRSERLIRADAGVLLYRKIWERELKAFMEDRPVKHWARTERVRSDYSHQHVSKTNIEEKARVST